MGGIVSLFTLKMEVIWSSKTPVGFYRTTGIPRFIALRRLRFLQIEGLWKPCIEQVYRRHFSNSMCSLRVSVPHFGNSRNISKFFIFIISKYYRSLTMHLIIQVLSWRCKRD
jgi:hypothetical protein